MRFLFFVLLGYIVYRLLSSRKQVTDNGQSRPQQATETYKDPICGVYVSAEDAVTGRHDGERLYFCSLECLEKYREQLSQTNK